MDHTKIRSAYLDLVDEGVPGSAINMHEVAKGGASRLLSSVLLMLLCDAERAFYFKSFVIVVIKFNSPTNETPT